MKRILSMILAMLLSVTGCSLELQQEAAREEPFTWTLSAEQLPIFENAQGCMDYLKENVQDPFLSGEIGADGSLTLTMTEVQREAILEHCRVKIGAAMLKHNDGSKIRITVSEDCRELHTYGLMQNFPTMAYLEAGVGILMFSLFVPEDYGDFTMYMHNADTEKLLGSAGMDEGKIKVDERKWADSYVLTQKEAKAYTKGKECRDWTLFETLTSEVPDSYILLVRALPRMVTEDYSYLYLDEEHRFHLGLTPEQEEKTREKTARFLEDLRSSLETNGVVLEYAPDLSSCRLSLPEGEIYGLNHYVVLTQACLLAQQLEDPKAEPFVTVDIYQGDTYLGTADTEKGIPQGILPDALVLGKEQ